MNANSQTLLDKAFDAYKAKIPGRFTPDRKFYTDLGINQKRLGQLLRGDKEPTTGEIKRLANMFGVPVTDLL